MEEKDAIYRIALAGLLHDIGKFAQRADAPLREIADAEARKDVKYAHALAGYSFVQDFAGALPAEVRKALSGVVYHHAPRSDVDECIRLADFLAAGEREELDGDKDDRKVPYLRSIFGRLAGQDLPGYLPLKPLQFQRSVLFPQLREVREWREEYRNEYFRLWEEFERASRPLKEIADPAFFLEFLLQRMLEFTWCIPSAYHNAVPDISLYDHSRMTAALAACLTADHRSGEWCRTVGDEDEVAVLVAGDLAGIQDFIYSLTSAGAARTLRGRSFYVQLLTEVVADFILRQLGLPPTNLIYAGGGNFYLLAGVSQQERLKEISCEVTRRLVIAHKGAVHLTLAWAPLKKADFDRARFPDAWRRLHEEFLLPAKHRPLAALPAEELFAIVGTPAGVGGDRDQSCSICGAERQKGEHFQKEEEPGAEPLRKCELCHSFEELGRALTRATHFLWLRAPIPSEMPPVRTWQTGLEAFGVRVALIDVRRPLEKQNALPLLDGVTLARISPFPVGEVVDESPLLAALGTVPVVRTVRPLAQLVPPDNPTFDQLARRARGIRRWGVLRMDVDDLGKLFQQELTLSRLATLSLSLRLFFEGWLPYLASPQEGDADDLRQQLYLQYAGGDDLFIVGAWDALPRFAERVRRSFAEYVAWNPGVTISGGISLADPRYPLYQAAREVRDAEKAAKSLPGKNAVTFLGQALTWDQFAEARQRANTLADWCENRGAPKALFQTLLEIAAEYERTRRQNRKQRGRPHFGRWMWVSFYQLTRTAAQVKDREVKEGIIAIRDELLNSATLIQTIGLAARWAEFLTRKERRE
jgi:CRISPR-associated protein Csm1